MRYSIRIIFILIQIKSAIYYINVSEVIYKNDNILLYINDVNLLVYFLFQFSKHIRLLQQIVQEKNYQISIID